MTKKTDLRQLESRDVLAQITGQANVQADTLVATIDSELTPPLVLRATGADRVVSVGGLSVQNPLTLARRTTPPIANQLPVFTSGTVTFPASSGGNAVPSVGSSIVITVGSGQYLKVGINLDYQGNLVLRSGVAGASEALATVPPPLSGAANAGMVVLHNVAGTIQNITQSAIIQYVGGGGNGSGTGLIKVDLYDPVSITLPTGASPTIDGVTVLENDLVFFTNLTSNNHRVYKATNVAVSTVWEAQGIFESSSETPSSGDMLKIKKGVLFSTQIVTLTDTGTYLVNDVIRLFNGDKGTSFWELGSIKTLTMPDNTADDTVFTVAASGSENWIVSYSIVRTSANKETGQIYITQNGTIASIAVHNTYVGDPGVTFSAIINAGDLELHYSTTSTGDDATMKFFTHRWSDAAGGPSGIPSYPSGGGSGTPAAGNTDEIQYKGSLGVLSADSKFKVDAVNGALLLDGLSVGTTKTGTLADNTTAVAITIPIAVKHMVIEYSLERDGDTQIGRFLVTNNGTVVAFNNDSINTAPLGVSFAAAVNAGNVEISHTSTSTGFTSSFKYSIRSWS